MAVWWPGISLSVHVIILETRDSFVAVHVDGDAVDLSEHVVVILHADTVDALISVIVAGLIRLIRNGL